MRTRDKAWLVCIASIESYRVMIESRIDDRLSSAGPIPYTSKCIPQSVLTLYTSAISLNRLSVDRIAAAAGVLYPIPVSISRPSPLFHRPRSGLADFKLDVRHCVCSSSYSLLTSLAGPDAH
jgi:hypothetical protein